MARQRPLHAFVPSGHYGEECFIGGITRSYALCTCGLEEGDPVHALPPATRKPEVPAFMQGDRVEWEDHETVASWARMPAGTGTVESWVRPLDQPATRIQVTVLCDECQAKHVIYAKHLRKLVPVPKFASVEEAQAWLEANA